ncbi:MAG: penicillin-binding protein 1C [Bacteroidetes bacterium]|nr:penicillin-binding protein 1C [Bacteroidota bacterium]
MKKKIVQYFNRFLVWCKTHKFTYRHPRFWISCVAFAFLVWFYFCLPKPLFSVPYSTVLQDRNGVLLSARIAADNQWRFPLNDSVPHKFKVALRYFEDEYFYRHPGINPVSMARALRQNVKHKRTISGGSTLSMQVIRLSRYNPSRSMLSKFYEMLLALRLELRYSKDEIMNLYAAHAPFGGNVVGLDAASWRYYNRPPNMLSWGEMATLAVLPNAPALVFPGKNHELLLKKRNRLIDKLQVKGVIDHATAELAKMEDLPGKPQELPQFAHHLLVKAQKEGFDGQRIHSTLDYTLQKSVQAIAQKYGSYYAENLIQNCAVLVLDTQTGAVLVYVGNITLRNKQSNQFVDNVVSLRSSGSILKPFLHAAMLSEGAILPHSLLSDIPTRIGGYAPKNFEKNFLGVVPANQALALSLNIPAVRLLQEYGVDKFQQLLKKTGFSSITKPADHYGLSLILGGAEVSLWETTSAYASMARSLASFNNGSYQSSDYRPAHYIYGTKIPSGEKTESAPLDAGALYSTFSAMLELKRPWGELGWEHFSSRYKIAWKTGTSFGFRDAWAVGTTPRYTVGVWVGNSTGEGRPALTGISYAAPVMFEVFKQLQSGAWFEPPQNDMTTIAVCSESGFRAGKYCTAVQQQVPKMGVRAKECPFHRAVFLDSTRQYRVTGACYAPANMVIAPWFVLSPTQEFFYKQHNPNYKPLPPYMEGCQAPKEQVLDIIDPDNNTAIFIPRSEKEDEENKIIFSAVHRNPKAMLFWHIDNEFIGSTQSPHTIEVAPPPGKHTVIVMDENGNSVQRWFRILENKGK